MILWGFIVEKDDYLIAAERFRVRRLDWEAAELERILKDVVSEMNREKSKLIFGDGE